MDLSSGSLPFVSLLIRVRFLAWLVLRAYSPKAFIGRNAWLAGQISDPDITIIGPEVVIGEGCHIVAHSVIRTVEGNVLFQSALIELGEGCTISGGTQIEMGVTVGAGSLVEPCSRCACRFTKIPGESLGRQPGGVPAQA